MISAGPIAFSAKDRASLTASICRQLFSGCWRSSCRNPVEIDHQPKLTRIGGERRSAFDARLVEQVD